MIVTLVYVIQKVDGMVVKVHVFSRILKIFHLAKGCYWTRNQNVPLMRVRNGEITTVLGTKTCGMIPCGCY